PTSTVIPVTGIRARIAERMSVSRRTIPDATCSVVADYTRLIELRVLLNEAATRRGLPATITPFSLVCRLAVQALRAAPTLNSTFVDDVPEIRVHANVHLGVGTATDRGLVVAVVRDAQTRTTVDLAGELARLAQSARAGSLAPSDMVGSTFTVSNFGALGLDDGIPVINHPEAAILGVGSVKPRPHVVDGQVVARPTGSLTLAFDHRVCDGAEAARFLVELRSLIESPQLALLDS
ncbi:MAG: branched-chain alpha-keto acid dehydrogenase subunit, partial [Ilumatobacteraceae bacterium]|nr:branched-chain alpha-keto acid dehydrogenase subunit [Ilumatobacteraceae bacterium]